MLKTNSPSMVLSIWKLAKSQRGRAHIVSRPAKSLSKPLHQADRVEGTPVEQGRRPCNPVRRGKQILSQNRRNVPVCPICEKSNNKDNMS